jgi:hypothetical protein
VAGHVSLEFGGIGSAGRIGQQTFNCDPLRFELSDALRQAVELTLILEGQFRGCAIALPLRRRFCCDRFCRFRGERRAALAQIVAIAADIFMDDAIAFQGDDAGDEAIEEIAVVTDQQQSALIIGQHLFEEIECLYIEIVGRLIEDQQIRCLRQHLRQQEPIALASRQRIHLGLELPLLEQEVLEV